MKSIIIALYMYFKSFFITTEDINAVFDRS